jgi:Na+-exporting ATPase
LRRSNALSGKFRLLALHSDPTTRSQLITSDRICLVFSGSQVTKGRAKVVIFSTGMNTEIGKIAHALESKAERTETGFARFWHKCKVLLGVAETTPLQIK